MTSYRFSHAIWLAGFLALAVSSARAMPAPADTNRILTVDEAPRLRLAQAQPQPSASPQAADSSTPADQQSAPEEPIGNVATLTGVATVTRNNADTPLQVKDDIYLNDVVKTQASSSMSITFSDATTFRLSANAQITIDNYVYEEGGGNNAGAFDIAKGTVAFVAAQVAKTGTMQITTPTASLGIRGTTGVVDVPEGAAATSANNVNIKLYPDADGRVGHIDINDRQGARLGALTQAASGFAIRPGAAAAGGAARFAAVPITLTPQQQQRDQGFVRQVHTAQTTGRQIFVERRDFRRANPTFVNPNAPRRQSLPGQSGQQPGQNRPGQPGQPQQPGQTRPGQPQQQGTPNGRQGQQQPGQPGQQTPRPGQKAQPTTPGQPGATPRPGQTTQPTTPGQPNAPLRPGQTTPSPAPGQNGTLPRSGQNGLPPAPGQPGTVPRPGQTTLPSVPGQPGVAPRPGQTTLPPVPGQPGLPQRPGQFAPPAPGQLPAQPRVQPGSPPPLPNGQPLLRQPPGPGRPQFAPPGAPRPGLQNRPGLPRPGKPAPPPKDKKKER